MSAEAFHFRSRQLAVPTSARSIHLANEQEITPTSPQSATSWQFVVTCRSLMEVNRLPQIIVEPERSNVGALGPGQRVADLDAEMPLGVLNVGVAQEDLSRPQIASCLLD